ncbi:hypothetical protein MXB_5347 [Myxobolus squamalis]|nr:hypothetical protein MXB_5347 [Myxobolus squamalis]
MPKYHLFFSISFFVSATLYFFLNALFAVQISKLKNYERPYKHISLFRIILISLILTVSLVHVSASLYGLYLSRFHKTPKNELNVD